MARTHQITIGGQSFRAPRGQLLLDAALSNGVELPHDCRAGHCGSCCVRLVEGEVRGGMGAAPGIAHACQCRIVGDAVLEMGPSGVRTVEGVLTSLRALSHEVVEVGITTSGVLPYHAGQYAQVRFNGYPSRPFSLTHPLETGRNSSRSTWFHVRRNSNGRVTTLLGRRIKPGHKVELTGPYGSAHFRPNSEGRMVLVATGTGFAPIWSIAVAALRENPERRIMIIAGTRAIESLYMAPALAQLASFRNVVVVPVCSTPHSYTSVVKFGRPTDYLPRFMPGDVLYACGAPGMVEAIKSIAARVGVVCYADPFLPTSNDTIDEGVLERAKGWLSALTGPTADKPAPVRARKRREPSLRSQPGAQAEGKGDSRFQRA
jgi:NAD(P)H-flavin reductase/ferredoxin